MQDKCYGEGEGHGWCDRILHAHVRPNNRSAPCPLASGVELTCLHYARLGEYSESEGEGGRWAQIVSREEGKGAVVRARKALGPRDGGFRLGVSSDF